MRVLYLIPARGGSKGLPGKNVRPLLGRPLIAWSVAAALEAARTRPGRVVVSTDDAAIADTARSAGAELPFLRPAELATDTASSMDVVLHALDHLEQAGEAMDLVCMLEPTSPQRTAADVLAAIDLLLATPGAESVVGVCRTEGGHPAFLARMDDACFIRPYAGERFVFKRRQEIDDVYFFEGSLYIARSSSLRERRSFYHERTLGHVMPKWKSFEVDDPVDLILIEALMKARQEGTIDDR
ncbi:MAG TPA: acylneuraminate cytidylyltransferase family protein [Flavobacteriales bacterium]|nr:acylneuraminate cytidylyltransferase family protein [Flavobacteriales bacterium]